MKTEEEIRERIKILRESAKNAETLDERLYFSGRIAVLEWVLED